MEKAYEIIENSLSNTTNDNMSDSPYIIRPRSGLNDRYARRRRAIARAKRARYVRTHSHAIAHTSHTNACTHHSQYEKFRMYGWMYVCMYVCMDVSPKFSKQNLTIFTYIYCM